MNGVVARQAPPVTDRLSAMEPRVYLHRIVLVLSTRTVRKLLKDGRRKLYTLNVAFYRHILVWRV